MCTVHVKKQWKSAGGNWVHGRDCGEWSCLLNNAHRSLLYASSRTGIHVRRTRKSASTLYLKTFKVKSLVHVQHLDKILNSICESRIQTKAKTTPHDRDSKSNYFSHPPPGHPQRDNRDKDMYIMYITSASLSNDKAPGLSLTPQFEAFPHHQSKG